jgi:hypothetical protein
LKQGCRTTGVCSTCINPCISFYNIFYIVVTNWSDCHCCHRYCNINNKNYTTVSNMVCSTWNFYIFQSTISTTLLSLVGLFVTITDGTIIYIWYHYFQSGVWLENKSRQMGVSLLRWYIAHCCHQLGQLSMLISSKQLISSSALICSMHCSVVFCVRSCL